MATYPPLFQFRKINNFLFQTLINKTLWFSSPKVFNDPFDCQLPVQTDNSLEEITKYLLQLNSKTRYYPNRQQVDERARMLKQDSDYLKNFLRNEFFNERRFTCFIDKEELVYQNSTMWGNYADKCKGVCLKFDFFEDIKKSFELESNIKSVTPIKVQYEKGIPTFNYIRHKLGIKQDFSSSNRYFIGTKSIDWVNESEVRLVIDKLPNCGIFESEYVGVKYAAKCLKEIILGCNTSKEDREIFENIVKCNPEYSNVKVQSLKKSDKWFGFEPQ